MTDQRTEENPFSHFSTAIAFYHAKRMMESKTQPGVLQSALENPSLTPIIEFQKKLDAIVNQTYINARRNLEKQDQTDLARYTQIKAEMGVLCLDYLALKHDKMHADYALTFYAPFLPQYLREYLTQAQSVIQIQSPSVSFTEAIDDDDYTIYTAAAADEAVVLRS